jgi:RNA polymerase sigma-70 factor (ECF subfamily)
MRQGELDRVFHATAGKLGERQRSAFVLREIEGFDTAEVAEILRVSRSTVRNLVHQARQGLRRELRKRFPEYAPPKE